MSIKRIPPRPLISTLGLDGRMEFGKYKGRSIAYIIGEEPSYVKWLLEREQIKLSDGARALYKKSIYAQRYDRPSYHPDDITDTFDRIIHDECNSLRDDIVF